MSSLAFWPDALSEGWNEESHCKQSTQVITELRRLSLERQRLLEFEGIQEAKQRKNSRNQHGGCAFSWLIIHVNPCMYMVKFHNNKQKMPRSDKQNNSQKSHKTSRHWNSVFRQSLATQKGSHLNSRVKLALEEGYYRPTQHSLNSSLEGTNLSSRIINVCQDKTKLKRQHNQNIQQFNSHNI